jgi:hypothetical protein
MTARPLHVRADYGICTRSSFRRTGRTGRRWFGGGHGGMFAMNEDELLERFGLYPRGADIKEIRRILMFHAAREHQEQGDGDTLAMRLCCVQLFNVGELADTMLIWGAKESSFDSHFSIDVQLLCGQGLPATKAHLASVGTEEAHEALDYLRECEASGDFDGFSAKAYSASCESYYLP